MILHIFVYLIICLIAEGFCCCITGAVPVFNAAAAPVAIASPFLEPFSFNSSGFQARKYINQALKQLKQWHKQTEHFYDSSNVRCKKGLVSNSGPQCRSQKAQYAIVCIRPFTLQLNPELRRETEVLPLTRGGQSAIRSAKRNFRNLRNCESCVALEFFILKHCGSCVAD